MVMLVYEFRVSMRLIRVACEIIKGALWKLGSLSHTALDVATFMDDIKTANLLQGNGAETKS